ncbi:hypothetical protein CC1G_10227 [Coprinopsis cinerea okayama7|uniref:Uncharacterized protein n=1 Tax=Coprinopsis cinerea (strain Okayama-7 / 130 / ATCC MYA-4618 / FGSC 9003) TaxID=240176 RepID=A8NPB3_COPC7|nr:hypothetical protein CC1G_10227 [Coprinopsis cinerea okayama7\|eukprot:XP_001835300.2 hypothetical protein CC1G_10227 [Coprinopsis cinerea okayama7\
MQTTTLEPARGYQLTASQVAYLKTRVDQYRDKKKKAAKDKVASSSARVLKEDYEQMTHQAMSLEMEKSLRKAVGQWLEQNALSSKGAPKRVWGMRWHARLVFQYCNTRAIVFLAKILAASPNPNIPDLRDLYEDPDLVIPPDQSIEDFLPDDAHSDDDSAPTTSPFAKYQTATSLLWGALDEAERADYAAKAKQWKEQGPPLEEKLRCAECYIRARCMEFSLALHNDMDARVFLLIGYRDEKKEPVAVSVEFNRELGACEESFSTAYPKETTTIEDLWRDWVSDQYGQEARGESSGGKLTKVRGRPLETLECDELGRPLLPPLYAKPRTPNLNAWLGDVFRSYFTRYYEIHVTGKALPEVVPPNSDRSSAPWAALAEFRDQCFDETCFDRELWPLFKDPAHMKVGPQLQYYNYFLSRQEDPSVEEVFRFKLVPVRTKNGYKLVSPSPRKPGSISPSPEPPKKRSAKGKEVDRSRRDAGFGSPSVRSQSPPRRFGGFSPHQSPVPSFAGFSPTPSHQPSPPPPPSPSSFGGFSPRQSPVPSFAGFSPTPSHQPSSSPPSPPSAFGGFSPRQSTGPLFAGFSPVPSPLPSSPSPPPAFLGFSPRQSPAPSFTGFSPTPSPGPLSQQGSHGPSTPSSSPVPRVDVNPPGKTPGSSRVPKNIGLGLQVLPNEVLNLPRTTRGAARKRAAEDELPQPPRRSRGRAGRGGRGGKG